LGFASAGSFGEVLSEAGCAVFLVDYDVFGGSHGFAHGRRREESVRGRGGLSNWGLEKETYEYVIATKWY